MERDRDLHSLEEELRRLAGRISYPPTPSLAAAVRRRLEAGAPAPPPRWRRALAPSLAAALATLLLAFAITLAISSGAREAIADFFGLDRVKIFRLAEEPEGVSGEIAATLTSLQRAEELAGFQVRLPTYPPGIGEPDEVGVLHFGEETAIELAYFGPDIAFRLLETRGSIGKGLGFEATVEAVTVGDGTGLWLQGQRVVQFLDEEGSPIQESQRVTDVNTLIWEDEELLFRLEGDLSLEEAIRIAESLR